MCFPRIAIFLNTFILSIQNNIKILSNFDWNGLIDIVFISLIDDPAQKDQ